MILIITESKGVNDNYYAKSYMILGSLDLYTKWVNGRMRLGSLPYHFCNYK